MMSRLLIISVTYAIFCHVWCWKQTSSIRAIVAHSRRSLTQLATESKSDSFDRRKKRRRLPRKVEDSGEEALRIEESIQRNEQLEQQSEVQQRLGTSPTNDLNSMSTTIEEALGLGNNQLRDLLETELPVPREDRIVGKGKTEEEDNKGPVFRLPDLREFLAQKVVRDQEQASTPVETKKINRQNREEYLRALQLNPFADADESLFEKEYDIIPSIFGEGKLLGIPVPYLQTGHGILVLIALLSGFVYYPGNPLTEFPIEIRTFLQQGLAVVYTINAVLAVRAFFMAKGKNLPAVFWAVKCFIFGGVAFYEISQAQDPTKKLVVPPTELPNRHRSSENSRKR